MRSSLSNEVLPAVLRGVRGAESIVVIRGRLLRIVIALSL